MKNIKNIQSSLGPEEFRLIYQGTEEFLEKNPNNSENKQLEQAEIYKINDIVVNKLYNNIKYIITTSNNNLEIVDDEKTQNNLIKYINLYNFQDNINKICDKSIKKSIDVLLNPLLRLIIQTNKYKTTSCCSGRIIFFEKDKNFQNKNNLIFGRSGRILYSSHCHIIHSLLDEILETLNSNPQNKYNCYKQLDEDDEETKDEEEYEETKDDSNAVCSDDVSEYIENEVVLKFEPFLIHVECNNIEDASYLLNLCKYVGLKQSGIISIKKKIILAIRGNNLLETPILFKKYKNEKNGLFLLENKYMVSQEYLIHLINTCNNKMTLNIYQFLRLYHKLKRVFKIELCSVDGVKEDNKMVSVDKNNNTNSNVEKKDNNKKDEMDCNSTSKQRKDNENKSRYIDILGTSKLIKNDKLSMPLGAEMPVKYMTFAEDSKYLLRTRCCLAASSDFVVLFGGQENSKGKTICVCDLKNIQKGFKIFDIDESGPDCTLDSTLVCDGRVFITFGGRKNSEQFSNDVYLLYVYNDNQNLMAKWTKCEFKSDSKPKERFRHSVCMDKNKSTTQINDQNQIESTCIFYLSGGCTSCYNIDKSILGDVWRCSISYTVINNDVVCSTAFWEFLYHDSTFSCSSGSLAHRPSNSGLVFIGGYKNLNDLLDTNIKYLNELDVFDLNSKQFSKIKLNHYDSIVNRQPLIEQSDTIIERKSKENTQTNSCSPENKKIPANIMSHCLVPLDDDEYLIVGGVGGLQFLDHVWYLNLCTQEWHRFLTMPPGLRARFGTCLVSFVQGDCRHKELWLIGGGMPIMVTYGSIFEKPLRIILSCEHKCKEISKNTNKCRTAKNFNNCRNHDLDLKNGSFYIGMYIIIENQSLIKHFKNLCENLSVFDKNRKILKLVFTNQNINKYYFHSSCCQNNNTFSKCPECKHTELCTHCKCCSSCYHSYYSSFQVCFLIPVLRGTENPDLSSVPVFNIFTSDESSLMPVSGNKNKIPQNPKNKFLGMINENGFESFKENIKSVGVCGDALLITLKNDEEKVPEVNWQEVADHFSVNSIALVGEIDGQKRQRKSRLLYGSGEVVTTENGVKYHFNILSNMFSKGNSSERIRIVKTYYERKEQSKLNESEIQKKELVLDLFCGIGYFSVPILKFTEFDRVQKVVCVDVNDLAIKYLLINADSNGIDRNRIETYNRDCSEFGEFFGREYVDKVDRVLLGLLPSSEVGWIPALRAINKERGGILHIHGLTKNKGVLDFKNIRTNVEWNPEVAGVLYTDEEFEKDKKLNGDVEYFSLYAYRMIYELCKNLKFMKNKNWSLDVLVVQNVKHYSPHKYHQVLDLKLTPIF